MMRDIMMRVKGCMKKTGTILLCYLLLLSLYFILIDRGFVLLLVLMLAVWCAVIRKWPMAVAGLCLLVSGYILCLPWPNHRVALEQARFAVFHPLYQNEAERIAEEVSESGDTYIFENAGRGVDMALWQKVWYIKKDNCLAVFFITSSVDVSGYLYVLNQESRDMIEHPQKYWMSATEEFFEECYELDGQWMFVKSY